MAALADVSLSRVTHDMVQNTYKELHALLDSLGDAEVGDRRKRLLDFFLKGRHRFARLLVAVRWFMSYSAFHSSAALMRNRASYRTMVLTEDADTLWLVSNLAKGAAAQPSAVQAAAEVLGASAVFARIPRCIEASIGIDLAAANVEQSDPASSNLDTGVALEAVERLSVATRYIVQNALPPGVIIIAPRVDPGRAAVRIGLPGAWTADLILDRLKLDDAFLLLLRFSVQVDAHPDATGSMRSKQRSTDAALPLSKDLSEPLRQMFEDRMRWVAQDVHAKTDPPTRISKVLLCLSQAMTNECCGKLAMEHVRAQATALATHSAWRRAGIVLSGIGSQAADDIPVRIRYWIKSHLASSIAISLPSHEQSPLSSKEVLRVEHQERLPASAKPTLIDLQAINIEELLMDTCRLQAINELSNLQQFCTEKYPAVVSANIVLTGLSSVSLVISFDGHGPALHVGIYLVSGAFFIHAKNTTALAIHELYASAKGLILKLWKGERHFKDGLTGLKNIMATVIPSTEALLHSYAAMEVACAIDGGAIPYWPPGAPSVEKPERSKEGRLVCPPLMAVDRKRSKRFLSLQSIASSSDGVNFAPGLPVTKRARTIPMQYSISSDATAYIQPKRPEGLTLPKWCNELKIAACSMADWAEIRHAVDMRLRRDHLLREFEIAELGKPVEGDFMLKSPHRTALKLKSQPLEVDQATLLLMGNDSWKVQLTLTNDIFDDEIFPGQVVSYSSTTRQLTFSYPGVSIAALKCFGLDFIRARTAAALILGLSTKSKNYDIVRRTPSHIGLNVHGLKLTVGYGKHGFEIESSPPKPVVTTQLIPLMEEVLTAAGKNMGWVLSELLMRSLPIAVALEAAVPKDNSRSRVVFFNALRARFVVAHPTKQLSCGLEIDGREVESGVRVLDLARAVAASSGSKNRDSSSSQFKPIPVWDAIVNRLVSRNVGKAHHGGAAIVISTSLLSSVLDAIVKAIQN